MRTRLNEWWTRKDMRCCSMAMVLMTMLFSACADKAKQLHHEPEQLPVSEMDGLQSTEIRQRIATAIKKASPAIVRVAWDSTEPMGAGGEMNGVIVTTDGYVLTLGQHGLPAGKTIRIYLVDGRRVTAKALGSYWSWDIGLVKIADNGPWPHVQFGKSADARPGDLCITLRYPRPQSPTDGKEPSAWVGRILSLVPSWWLCTSCQFRWGDQGDGLFNLDGQLIGIQSQISPDRAFHPAIELVERYWQDLIAGRQVDDLEPAGAGKATTESGTMIERLAEAVAKAKLATVRLVWGNKETDRVSGVIVTADGYVATCGHHWRPPGELITVYLADGRTVAGKVFWSIPFCDIGLMKITEKGPWPYVEFGSSLTMKRADMSILVGYPFAPIDDGMLEPQRSPAVRLGAVVDDTRHGPGMLSTSCFFLSGDSGGGVFDLEGRLVAIHTGGKDYEGPAYHTRIELLQKQWDFLSSGKSLDSLPSAGGQATNNLF
jgi:S1-C subfamily serine protease